MLKSLPFIYSENFNQSEKNEYRNRRKGAEGITQFH